MSSMSFPDPKQGPAWSDTAPEGALTGLSKRRYGVRLAQDAADIRAAHRLRGVSFRGADTPDHDRFDADCLHMLVEDLRSGELVCCFRLLHLASADQIDRSYSAQFYDLNRLRRFAGPVVEMGRFCIHPDAHDPDILRVAWSAMTTFVDREGIELLFGCASFSGTDPRVYDEAFALLRHRHLAPARWAPGIKAPETYAYARDLCRRPDLKRAQANTPALLRT
jgi:putative hemolysin